MNYEKNFEDLELCSPLNFLARIKVQRSKEAKKQREAENTGFQSFLLIRGVLSRKRREKK